MQRSVVVTGASSGIGEAVARKFAKDKRRLVLIARRGERLQRIADELSDLTEVFPVTMDVRERDSVMSLLAELPAAARDIEILVNNAGLAKGLGPANEANLDDWEAMVDTNIKGLMYVTRLVLPELVRGGGGHIVNIGSVAASWPYPGGNAYGGTKAFVQQFSRNLRADLLGKNIRVTNLEPGMAETEFSLVRFAGDVELAGDVYKGMKPLTGADISEIVHWVTSLPAHININSLEVMPVNQAWAPFAVHREQTTE